MWPSLLRFCTLAVAGYALGVGLDWFISVIWPSQDGNIILGAALGAGGVLAGAVAGSIWAGGSR